MMVAAGSKRLQLFAPSDFQYMYPFPSPSYHSSALPPFTDPSGAPPEWEHYRHARPIEVELQEGDMLYLPAFWYHCVQGGDGYNAILAWWTQIHPNKRDNAASDKFDPVRPAYEGAAFLAAGMGHEA